MIRAIEIQTVDIKDLKPAEYNPRKILRRGDKGYEKLKASLMEFGEVLPIVWNKRTGNIVGGHQRYYMYLDEGIQKVKVSVVDLPLEKEKALNITLNNPKVGSEWDLDKLAQLVQELETPELKLTGFDEEDLDSLLAGLDDLDQLEMDTSDFDELGGGSDPGEIEKEDPEPEELPYEEPQEEKPTKEVFFKIGKYEFMVNADVYNTWLQEIKATHGDDYESVIDEIKIRLGL
jgi:ParB-like chromosome segregation protein Spo0J